MNAAKSTIDKDNKMKQGAIKLDAKWISCSGSATHDIVKMFKIACLNYEPSPLAYRNKVYSYEEIQEIKGEILSKCEQMLVTDHVFKTLELHPKKLYDDTIIQRENKMKNMVQIEK